MTTRTSYNWIRRCATINAFLGGKFKGAVPKESYSYEVYCKILLLVYNKAYENYESYIAAWLDQPTIEAYIAINKNPPADVVVRILNDELIRCIWKKTWEGIRGKISVNLDMEDDYDNCCTIKVILKRFGFRMVMYRE